MSDSVLVTYASKVGSTAQVAREIAEVLRDAEIETDLRPVTDVMEVDPYRAVVLGSAIRFGKVLPEALRFVEKHRLALRQIPVAYFVVCMTMQEDNEINRDTVRAYLDPLIALVPPADIALFAGEINIKKLAPMLRMLVKAMDFPQGDFRNWETIRGWAEGLPALLLEQQAEST